MIWYIGYQLGHQKSDLPQNVKVVGEEKWKVVKSWEDGKTSSNTSPAPVTGIISMVLSS